MKIEEQREILNVLDQERQTVLYPGVIRFSDRQVVRDISLDGKSGEIVYSSCIESEVDRIIEHQTRLARSERYELEWKVYGHDQPPCLGECLAAAGFKVGEKESFMVFAADSKAWNRFMVCGSDIRRVTSREGLRDYQLIQEEACGRSCENEIERYGFMLANHPNNMSVYVAYVNSEPAACGRIYFHEGSRFAGLYGGNTREKFRQRGLFTELVAVRVREARSRGTINICVDALPASEPILRKQGFESVTDTQPFFFLG